MIMQLTKQQHLAENKIFSYKEGTGSADTELGFPLSYKSINNVGDIVFNYDLLNGSSTYSIENEIYNKTTDVGFLRKYSALDRFEVIGGWKKVDTLSEQPIIKQYIYDNTQNTFAIDVYERSAELDDLWVRVFVNNKLQFENVDFTIGRDINSNAIITFEKTPTLNDSIIIKTKSKAQKTDQGYYELPSSLERNPLNENLNEFTLGEVNDHVSSIVENLDNFTGVYPGVSNLRDISGLSQYGRRFLQHSAPMNLSLYHITDKDANIVKSIEFAKNEYGKFKRVFLQKAETSTFQGTIKDHVDTILRDINKDKSKNMPFLL